MKRSAVVFYLYPTTRQPLTDAILRLSEIASLWGYKGSIGWLAFV